MSFQDELQQLKTRIEGNLPPPTVKLIHEETAALMESGIKERVMKVGASAPTFALTNQAGELRDSRELLRAGPLVICFYRGFWCPYCNADLANLNLYLGDIQSAGAELMALSPEKQEYSKRIIRRQKLDFEILTDVGSEVAAAFGLRFQLSESSRALYRDTLNVNLKLYHGDDDWTLPMPARFVIDTAGIVRYSEACPDYTCRPDPFELLDVLRSL